MLNPSDVLTISLHGPDISASGSEAIWAAVIILVVLTARRK